MRTKQSILLILFIVLTARGIHSFQFRVEMEVDGITRNFIVNVPVDFHRFVPLPVVIALHGGGGNARSMLYLTREGFNRLAKEEGFIVVYPEAVRGHWNDGRGLFYYSHREGIDDVAFLERIIKYLSLLYPVDRNRIFITGMSNGGFMAYRFACEKPQFVRAIAPVAAPITERVWRKCHPAHPVGLLLIMGTDDPVVPWEGGEINFRGLLLGKVLSARATAEFWAGLNKCRKASTLQYLPDADPRDGTRAWRQDFTGCSGCRVSLIGIEGGGHTWPGGLSHLPEEIVGRTSRDFDACRIIWEFFKSCSRQSEQAKPPFFLRKSFLLYSPAMKSQKLR